MLVVECIPPPAICRVIIEGDVGMRVGLLRLVKHPTTFVACIIPKSNKIL
jgi:hypothetical protein